MRTLPGPRTHCRLQSLRWLAVALIFRLVWTGVSFAQNAEEEAHPPVASLELRDFRPRSMLRVAKTVCSQAKFPVVDCHTHFGFRLRGSHEQLDGFVDLMDRNNIALCASLDAKLGDSWQEHADFLWKKYPNRFVVFVHIDWQGRGADDDPASWDCHREDFPRQVARQLAEARTAGVSGLKIFKRFGLSYKNPDGSLMRIDDPRWDPIWAACGAQGLPVIIHTADPAAFFLPTDRNNERWEELSRRPEWSFAGEEYPSRAELLEARNRVVGRHPKTRFIGAHMANNPEDLATVGEWLSKYPNLYVEIASRIGELGRQPFTARKFLIDHADRVLFGTDGPWPETRVRLYWRFLETQDEYFAYSEKLFPPQGFWQIYGVNLPDEVLQKVYHGNAKRIIPGVRERLAAQRENAKNKPASASSPSPSIE